MNDRQCARGHWPCHGPFVPWLRGYVLAGLTLLLVGGAASADDAKPDIFVAAREGVAAGRIARSRVLGCNDPNRQFAEVPSPGAVLVGFDCGVGNFGNIETVYALRAIYRTASGETTFHDHGLFSHERVDGRLYQGRIRYTTQIKAKPGYAVAGVLIRSGLNFNGLALTFMRIDGAVLDPKHVYSSVWVGDRTGGSEAYVGAKGSPVVGIFGSKDHEHIMSLGLYFLKPASAAKKPAADPPEPVEEPQGVDKQAAAPAAAAVPEALAEPVKLAKKNRTAGPDWPLIVLGGASIPIVMLLLISVGRKRRLQDRDRADIDLRQQAPAPLDAINPELVPSARPAVSEAVTAISPSALPTSPVYEGGKELDPRDLARLRLSDEAVAQARKSDRARKEAALTLFAIAGMQLVCGLAMVAVLPNLDGAGPLPKQAIPLLAGWLVGIALAFAGLGVWAWHQPLPAALAGLVLYALLFLGDLATNPQIATQGILVKIAIFAALVRALKLGLDAQAAACDPLLRRLSGLPPAPPPVSPHVTAVPDRPPPQPPVRLADNVELPATRAVEVRKGRPEERPEWVRMGLWGIHSRSAAWGFFWFSIFLTASPLLLGWGKILGLFALAALWYWLCIKWMDDHQAW